MMASYLEHKLIDLLPPLYRIEDEGGDLQSFLNVTAPTLDELKELIDRFPQIFDVDVCEERWLPYLANLVGMPFDGTADPTAQRRQSRVGQGTASAFRSRARIRGIAVSLSHA